MCIAVSIKAGDLVAVVHFMGCCGIYYILWEGKKGKDAKQIIKFSIFLDDFASVSLSLIYILYIIYLSNIYICQSKMFILFFHAWCH